MAQNTPRLNDLKYAFRIGRRNRVVDTVEWTTLISSVVRTKWCEMTSLCRETFTYADMDAQFKARKVQGARLIDSAMPNSVARPHNTRQLHRAEEDGDVALHLVSNGLTQLTHQRISALGDILCLTITPPAIAPQRCSLISQKHRPCHSRNTPNYRTPASTLR